jgi:hypothetical protein
MTATVTTTDNYVVELTPRARTVLLEMGRTVAAFDHEIWMATTVEEQKQAKSRARRCRDSYTRVLEILANPGIGERAVVVADDRLSLRIGYQDSDGNTCFVLAIVWREATGEWESHS